jgi:hypothetical protein
MWTGPRLCRERGMNKNSVNDHQRGYFPRGVWLVKITAIPIGSRVKIRT